MILEYWWIMPVAMLILGGYILGSIKYTYETIALVVGCSLVFGSITFILGYII